MHAQCRSEEMIAESSAGQFESCFRYGRSSSHGSNTKQFLPNLSVSEPEINNS